MRWCGDASVSNMCCKQSQQPDSPGRTNEVEGGETKGSYIVRGERPDLEDAQRRRHSRKAPLRRREHALP